MHDDPQAVPSNRDDTSKPMLVAMRKAADQFTRERTSFIAIQEHGIEASNLIGLKDCA